MADCQKMAGSATKSAPDVADCRNFTDWATKSGLYVADPALKLFRVMKQVKCPTEVSVLYFSPCIFGVMVIFITKSTDKPKIFYSFASDFMTFRERCGESQK